MTTDAAAQDRTPGRKTAFDAPERARMRAALLRYMEEHRIGVPTLQGRIAQASGRSTELIPLKTLQRFLADSHRTNDAFLVPVYQFSKDLPERHDEFTAIAGGLVSFYSPPGSGSEPRPPGAFSLLGAFDVYEEGTDQSDRATQTGRMTFDPEQSPPALLVREHQYLPGNSTGLNDPAHIFEGIVVSFGMFQIGMMRSTLTHLPRIHWFAFGRGFALQSCCQSCAIQHTGPEPTVLPPRTFHLRPAGAETAKP
ncbi:MAG: hypothetical protein J0H65_13765 [Rhizobiales bacterium]|nr:hypothetical protein [Hyphomicrobiales bacterium]